MTARAMLRRIADEIGAVLFALPCALGLHNRRGGACRWCAPRSRRGLAA